MNKLLFLLGAFIYSSAAFASDIYMVKLSAQETGKQVWDLGIQTDKHDSIAGIVYREPNGEVLSFPLETTNRKAKVVLRIAVYDIVSLKTKVLGSQKIEMIFKYVYHFNLINPVRHEKRITLEFNPRTANFEAIDHDTSRVITQAYASSHYEDGRLKGIDEIRTQ